MHLDYSGFKNDLPSLRAEVIAADTELMSERLGSVLVLIDLRDTIASSGVVSMFKESSKVTAPYIRRYALIGVTGIKKYLAEKVAVLLGRPMRLFNTEDEAIGWLTASDEKTDAGDLIGVKG